MSARDKGPVKTLPKTNTSDTPPNRNPKLSTRDEGPVEIKGWDHWTPEKGSSNAVVWRIDVPPNIYLSGMPKFRGGPMPVPVFIMAYTGAWFFRPNGRCLLPQEIERIINAIYGNYGAPDPLPHVHAKLATTIAVLEDLSLPDKLGLCRQIAYLLKAVLAKSTLAKQRFDGLKGFVGRLEPVPFGYSLKPPKLGGRELWPEEIYFIGALLRWCKGDVDNISWKPDAAKIVERRCNITFESRNFHVYRHLSDKKHTLAEYTAKAFAFDNHENFFSRQARERHVECSNKNLLQYPAETTKIPAGSEPLLATTAEYFAALTISAHAESSRQPTATNPPAESSHQPTTTDFADLDFDEFLASDAYSESIAGSWNDFDSEPEAAPPAAAGGSTKGKGRARESSSPGSQEGGDSGKGKQAVRKKPRAGK